MRLLFSAIVFLNLSVSVFSQQSWSVSGIVRGDQGEALVGASVFVDGTFSGVTDTAGFYKVQQEAMPSLLTIRYLGYFPQKNALSARDFHNKRAVADFTLVNQAPVLGEVTITTKPIERIVKEDYTIDLYDFGFVGQHILLLLREKKHYLLRLIREDGEILSQLRLPEECRVLHRSCLGDFHVVGERSAWEVAFKDKNIDTLGHYPAEYFRKFVQPCVQQSAGQYYFVQHGLLNQSLRYVVFQDNKEPRVAFNIRDKKGEERAEHAVADFFNGTPMIYRTTAWAKGPGPTAEFETHQPWGKFGELSTVEGLTNLSGYGDDQIYRISELEVIRRDSVYAPILKINDTLCLFDHTNGRIVRFGPLLERSDVVFMSYHFAKNWAKLLLQDVRDNRVYACFSGNKGLVLKEIDPKNGREGKSYALGLAPYISEKFKVRNGLLYFIGQPDVNTPNKILYKVNIFAGLIK